VSVPSPRRVVVGLDASRASVAAANAAADVAAALGAELVALYVEDRELLRLADSPLATVVDRLFASSSAPASVELESQLRAEGARARAGLERVVAGRNLRWSFRVGRGRVAMELLADAGTHDLVVVGRIGAGETRGRLGRTARAVARERGGAVLKLAEDGGAEDAEIERWRAELGVEVLPVARSVIVLAGRLGELLDRLRSPVLVVG